VDAPLDWDRFMLLAVGDETIDDLVSFYVDHTTEELAALDDAVRRGDVSAVELIAHRMAGTSATAGAKAMVPPLAELEQRAHAGSIAGAAAAVEQARNAFDQVRRALAARTKIGRSL